MLRLPRTAALLALAALLPLATAATAGGVWRAPRYPEYDMIPRPVLGAPLSHNPYQGPTAVVGDADGDGIDDLFLAKGEYVAASAYRDGAYGVAVQINLDPGYEAHAPGRTNFSVALCRGLAGPDATSLVVWGAAADGGCRFWVVSLPEGRIATSFDLPPGPDVRADGRWDGAYFVIGAASVPRDGGETTALIVGCNVGFDLYGRSVRAVDPRDGAELWRYDMGPNPSPDQSRLADLDGDGRPEIIVLARSPQNLHFEKVNGTSDDATRLFVLDTSGRLLWDRVLGPYHGLGGFDLGDLTGDGRQEIVTAARATPSLDCALVVWDADGERIAATSDGAALADARILPAVGGGAPTILAADDDRLREFALVDGELRETRRLEFPHPIAINLVGDVLPPAGDEIVVSILKTGRAVLDREFRTLAVTGTTRHWIIPAVLWRPDAGTALLCWDRTDQVPSLLVKAPFARARLYPWLIGLGLIVLVGGAAETIRRRRPAPPDLRPVRLRLLELLALSSHGAIAPLRSVRRLSWHLRALQMGEGDSSRLEVRMRETWEECRNAALPLLREIVERADEAGMPRDLCADVRTNIERVAAEIAHLPEEEFAAARGEAAADRLEVAERRADQALRRLRDEVAAGFRCDVATVVRRVLAAHDDEIRRLDVRVAVGFAAAAADGSGEAAAAPSAPAAPLHVLCEEAELGYVMENLVANALAAMADAPTRRLRITWRETDGMGAVDVIDTGCGLAPDDRQRALDTRWSTRPGGGEGLPNSQRFLRKYGGSLAIVAGAPGRGTTCRVLLPLA